MAGWSNSFILVMVHLPDSFCHKPLLRSLLPSPLDLLLLMIFSKPSPPAFSQVSELLRTLQGIPFCLSQPALTCTACNQDSRLLEQDGCSSSWTTWFLSLHFSSKAAVPHDPLKNAVWNPPPLSLILRDCYLFFYSQVLSPCNRQWYSCPSLLCNDSSFSVTDSSHLQQLDQGLVRSWANQIPLSWEFLSLT